MKLFGGIEYQARKYASDGYTSYGTYKEKSLEEKIHDMTEKEAEEFLNKKENELNKIKDLISKKELDEI